MSLELIYTSAPKGIKPGSSGFCTVAMTQGMPAQLIDRLEALSGYRQLFAPQDPQASSNPVVCSHLRISVAGRNYHILSRVCASGLDYSQRANKFAYHVALDNNELPPAGPAWLLAMPGYMASGWDQSVRPLPPRGRPPNGAVEPAICHQWQQATGDAGWGGAMIDALKKNPRAMVTLIFRPGTDPLPLVAESLALLPPNERWATTFSTYFTKLPAGVDCRWRCVVEGSTEAKIAAGMVVDLSRSMGQPSPGEFVTAARTGQIRSPAHSPLSTRGRGPEGERAVEAEKPGDLQLAQLLGEPAAAMHSPAPVSTPSNAADWLDTLQPGPPSIPNSPLISTHPPRQIRRKESAKWPYMLCGLAVGLLLVAGGVLVFKLAKPVRVALNEPPVYAKSSDPAPANNAGKSPPADPGGSGVKAPKPTSPLPSSTVAPINDPFAKTNENSGIVDPRYASFGSPSAGATAGNPLNANASPPLSAAERARVALAQLPHYVSIKYESTLANASGSTQQFDPKLHTPRMLLCVLPQGLGAPTLALLGMDTVLHDYNPELIAPKGAPTEPRWELWADVGKPPERIELGAFVVNEKGELSFSWGSARIATGEGQPLCNCVLEVRLDGVSGRVQLRKPTSGEPLIPLGPLTGPKNTLKDFPLTPAPHPEDPKSVPLSASLIGIDGVKGTAQLPDGSLDVRCNDPPLELKKKYSDEETAACRRPLHMYARVSRRWNHDGNTDNEKWFVAVHLSAKLYGDEIRFARGARPRRDDDDPADAPDGAGADEPASEYIELAPETAKRIGAAVDDRIQNDTNKQKKLEGQVEKAKGKEVQKLDDRIEALKAATKLWRLKRKDFDQLQDRFDEVTKLDKQHKAEHSLRYQIAMELGKGIRVILLTSEADEPLPHSHGNQ